MAKYIHPNGDTIETNGSQYITTGTTERKCDISRWSDDAEKWIDNDIKAGYYEGFVKMKPVPNEWIELLIVCDACKETSQKSWAKEGAQGILCARCHPNTDGYSTLPRLAEAK